MMAEIHTNPARCGAFGEGFAAGVRFAEAHQDERARSAPRFSPLTRFLVRLVLVISAIGWTVGLGQLAGVIPGTAAHAATSSTTAMLQPAITAAASLRPVWNGWTPKRWTGTDAMCPASSARLHRWARTAPGAPWFRVECLADGPGLWAWNEITPKGR
jgi:hypothetical protein